MYDPSSGLGEKSIPRKRPEEGIHEAYSWGVCVMGLVQGQDQSWCC